MTCASDRWQPGNRNFHCNCGDDDDGKHSLFLKELAVHSPAAVHSCTVRSVSRDRDY